uniref:Uncharacterized protein n=1 Tax=Solanum lycopersicum TaxID=4081 RepID=A0A3Q7IIF0_SOLLC
MRGTFSSSLYFGKGNVTLKSFVDADLGGVFDSSKSTSGYIYTIVEYMAITDVGKEIIWLEDYLEELGKK